MKRSLKTRLILTYLAVALVTILIVVLVIQLTSDKSLRNMVADQQIAQLSEAVQSYYTSNGSLDGFFDNYIKLQPPADHQAPPDSFDGNSRFIPIRGITGLVDSNYRAVFPTFNYAIGATVPPDLLKDAEPVTLNGETIAYILRDPTPKFDLSPEEQRYVQRTNLAIGLAAFVGVATAVVVGIVLAGGIIKPIQKLTQASTNLAQGELGLQVPVDSEDEIGQLTRTFNQMSADLAHSDQERKQMTADITHDLSTPLQIISGYVEMLAEGDVQLSDEHLDIIKTEIEHLRRLVGDLTTLSQVEGGGLEIQSAPIDPNQLLESVYRAYQPIAARLGITLTLDAQPTDSLVDVDEGRMLQVLMNLVENALRYTPAGGSVTLRSHVNDTVQLIVEDTGPGISPEDLPYVFDRFYQSEKSRLSSKGKMGLGLAICKALTEAMGCSITAYSAGKDQGTKIVITLKKSSQAPPKNVSD